MKQVGQHQRDGETAVVDVPPPALRHWDLGFEPTDLSEREGIAAAAETVTR